MRWPVSGSIHSRGGSCARNIAEATNVIRNVKNKRFINVVSCKFSGGNLFERVASQFYVAALLLLRKNFPSQTLRSFLGALHERTVCSPKKTPRKNKTQRSPRSGGAIQI